MEGRDRLLRSAALAFSGAFALYAVEHAFRLSDVLTDPHPTGLVVAECLSITQFLVLSLASFFAAQAFLSPPEKRAQGLREAAALAAASYGFELLSTGFTAGVNFSEPHSHAYRIAGVLDGVVVAALMIAALLAAIGFSQRERVRRDYFLGWTGIAFTVANLVALVAGVLRSEGYTDQNGFGTMTAGLNLGTTGLSAAAIAGAIAAFAFFDAAQAKVRRRTPLSVGISCSRAQPAPTSSPTSLVSQVRRSSWSLIQAWDIPTRRPPQPGSPPSPHSLRVQPASV
jgi:hypothetical protein